MANHFIAVNRGANLTDSNFVFGTATSAASDIELRVADLDGSGNIMKKEDVIVALEMFMAKIISNTFIWPQS